MRTISKNSVRGRFRSSEGAPRLALDSAESLLDVSHSPHPSKTGALLLCLATQKGLEVLKALLPFKDDRRLLVTTFQEKNVARSFDEAITEMALDAGLTVCPSSRFRSEGVRFLHGEGISAALCIGWKYLISAAALEYLEGEVIVAHDALLPKFRGFAPLPTALIAGERETGVTFLRAGAGIDTGDIYWQGRMPIEPRDTIADLVDRIGPLYAEGAIRYLQGQFPAATPQDHAAATYSLWRDTEDFRIDWNDDADRIERTVRALGPPYLGACTSLGGSTVIIQQAEIVPDLTFAIRQPGKIWSLDESGRPTVVCGRGLLKILSATADGRSILPVTTLRQRFGSSPPL